MNQSDRLSLRMTSEDKALLTRAAVLAKTNVSQFITQAVVAKAQELIRHHETIALSERDSLRVLEALEQPVPISPALRQAARDLPQ